MTVLEGKDLCKRYTRGAHTVEALADASFVLERGEILGIVGESGSGKSTLLRQISGLEAPDSGTLTLEGKPLGAKRTKAEKREVQMIFQDAVGSFHPCRSVAASIREAVRNLRGTEPDIPELCALVGLPPELAARRPGALSGGQCQRFAIARAVAVAPKVLLCDEITSALDVSSQAQVLKLLSEVCAAKGLSALLVSHDIAVVRSLCRRAIVMRSGRMIERGSTEELISRPAQEYTRQLIASVML